MVLGHWAAYASLAWISLPSSQRVHVRGWIKPPTLRMSVPRLVHLRTCYQVSPADCKVHQSECCHVLSGWTFRSLHGCLLSHVIKPVASHFLFCCNSLKPLAGYSCWGYGRLCLFASLSVALSSTVCSDWSAVNISASPPGMVTWLCVCVCVCVHLWMCVCVWESEQQVAPLLNQPYRVDSLHTELSGQ